MTKRIAAPQDNKAGTALERNAAFKALSSESLPNTSGPADAASDLVKAIAMDIGKELAAFIEVMYPEAVKATSSTFLLSVCNVVYNEIMEAIKFSDEGIIGQRLESRRKFRKAWKAAYKKIRA